MIDSMNNKIYTIEEINNLIKPILAKRNIKDMYLFGSYARKEANKDSDVDIYCDRGDVKGAIDVASLIEELEMSLNKKVDLIFTSAKLEKTFENSMKEELIRLC